MTRRTSYTAEYMDEMRERFFERFNADERTLAAKLKGMHMPKGTYSALLNVKHGVSKHTLETMRAYLEGRTPKHKDFDPLTHGYCSSCEQVTPKASMESRWSCRPCKSEIDRKSKQKHWQYHQAFRRAYKRKLLVRGPMRAKYLATRKRAYLNKHYGKFGPVVDAIHRLKKEMTYE